MILWLILTLMACELKVVVEYPGDTGLDTGLDTGPNAANDTGTAAVPAGADNF